jgi:hypothetical protein
MKRIVNVLSLGAGVQSTALYLKFARGEMPVQLDAAIFADTQEEPEAVYRHLDWLRSLGGPPILIGTAGKLGEDLGHWRKNNAAKFVPIPAFTTQDGGATVGVTRRQCSKEYKTEIIGRVIRREILGLAPGQAPKGIKVNQFIGISLDEWGRAKRMERNIPVPRYIDRRFPLIEQNLTRQDCVTYNAQHIPHEVPPSACVFCPYHNDYEWDRQKRKDPQAWQRSIEVDYKLRLIDPTLYLHRSCQALECVQLNPQPPTHRSVQLALNFAPECEGVCGV